MAAHHAHTFDPRRTETFVGARSCVPAAEPSKQQHLARAARALRAFLRTWRRRSSTTRSGWRGASIRTSRRGLSASTVAALVSTALLCARQCCTSARAASLVIHCSPHWRAPCGRRGWPPTSGARTACRCRMRMRKPAFRASASRSSNPDSTLSPAARRRCGAAPTDPGIRVADGVDHAAHARGEQGIHTGRRAAVMTARLERDIGRGAARPIARGADRVGFGVRLTGAFMPALPHDFVVARQHRAHPRIWMGAVQSACRELERPAHGGFIERTELLIPSCRGFCQRLARQQFELVFARESCRAGAAAARSPRERPRRPGNAGIPMRSARRRLRRACAVHP